MTTDTQSAPLAPPPIGLDPAPATLPLVPRPDRESNLAEIAAVLLLAVFPDICRAASALVLTHSNDPYPFLYTASTGLTRSLQVSVPVLYILSRSRDPWSDFGITRPRLRRDLPLALLALVAAYGSMTAFTWGLYWMHPDLYRVIYNLRPGSGGGDGSVYAGPRGAAQCAILVLMSLANGFTEELVMRGYLIRRFEQLFKSTAAAVVVSTLLFASYHIYYGALGALNILLAGLALGLVYARWRRLWPVALAHAAWDFLGFIRLH